jgi:hypothetical protein
MVKSGHGPDNPLMKVLDLECRQQHVFEGWFGSDDDFRSQLERGLLSCPLCGDGEVQRRLSAPRLARKSNARPASEPATPAQAQQPAERGTAAPAGQTGTQASARTQLEQAAYLQAVQHVLQHTEDVGARFAEEARRIHYGEIESRGIRGQATAQEKAALADEGIEVVSLALPKGMDGPLQ